ncbi:hypothetical protein [Fodinibius sp.]|uniref:hypothetical protein n=1 Tax=Fodinibius sp. TaxID=1872440 RepID=UPI002ACEDE1D|nr:hypothetical protein [Fodinibius sp.]MDZ7658042.1 hypothetical protein [Fodinibius sp.]
MTTLQNFEKARIRYKGKELDVYYEETSNGISLRDSYESGTRNHVGIDFNDQDEVRDKIRAQY